MCGKLSQRNKTADEVHIRYRLAQAGHHHGVLTLDGNKLVGFMQG
jgi:hypothetical protein